MNEETKEKSVIEKNRHYFVLNIVFMVFLFFIITLDWLSTIVSLKFPIFSESNMFMAPIINTGNWYLIALAFYFPVLIPFIITNNIAWEEGLITVLKIELVGLLCLCVFRSWVVFNNVLILIVYL